MRTGGPWSLEETHYHINYLELLAVYLALQMFVKNKENVTVQMQTDNISAMTYINRRGGTRSPSLTALAKRIWEWCLERAIHLEAEHLPGVLNVIAIEESRVMKDRWDWNLNPTIFNQINKLMVLFILTYLLHECPPNCPVSSVGDQTP